MKKQKPLNLREEDSSILNAEGTMKTHTENPHGDGASEASLFEATYQYRYLEHQDHARSRGSRQSLQTG